jgi:hypothetical protein
MLARDVACLDLVCGGRSVLCFVPPFVDALVEAVTLCRALWFSTGEVVSDGPRFPVRAAAGRARQAGESSPLVAFDLSAGDELPAALLKEADLLLWPSPDGPEACRMERV